LEKQLLGAPHFFQKQFLKAKHPLKAFDLAIGVKHDCLKPSGGQDLLLLLRSASPGHLPADWEPYEDNIPQALIFKRRNPYQQ
jgi:hypothetical protein